MNRIAVSREMGSPLHHQIYLVLATAASAALLALDRRLRRHATS